MLTISITKLIGWIEIIGGIIRLFLVLTLMEDPLVFYLLALTLFCSSIVSGVMLIKDKTMGYVLSIVIQVFQIPRIISSSISYIFFAGSTFNLDIYHTLDKSGLKFNFWIVSSNFNISL